MGISSIVLIVFGALLLLGFVLKLIERSKCLPAKAVITRIEEERHFNAS